MDLDEIKRLTDSSIEEKIKEELIKSFDSKRKRIFSKIFGAALGSVPWVGGFLSAMNDLKADESQIKNNQLYQQWLEEHKKKMQSLAETLLQVMKRLDEFTEEIDDRLESEEFMQIVRKSFRSWDKSDTQDKRELVRKLLTNSGAYSTVPDDLIRLFLDWIDLYHEIHFAVIKVIYSNPGVTRFEIWKELNGKSVREDSLEADLFKLLIRDLSTGSVIRQHRQTDYYGNFMKRPTKKSTTPSKTLKSAFDDGEGYELTELGQQFVSYTMNEIVPRIN
jgi:tRNA splicing endonuclease